ncbi:MAG: hypothetical protein ABSE08_02855 [Syntrophobacteraceae bacterium]|jgi:hypothetical protein
MNFKKVFYFLLFVFAFAVVQANNGIAETKSFGSGIDQWGNSPQVEFAPNGDRTSPYPPYYHPTE